MPGACQVLCGKYAGSRILRGIDTRVGIGSSQYCAYGTIVSGSFSFV